MENKTKAKMIIMGCGASSGIPAIGNFWGKCDPEEPKNIRTRASVAVVTNKTTIVVDTGPDFRLQFNKANLKGLDAVLYTHAHGDHINGIDELRTLQRILKKNFPVYTDKSTMEVVTRIFGYMFETVANGFYPKVCIPNIIEPYREYSIGDIRFTAFEQQHGEIKSLGFRFGNIAYSTDFKSLDDRAIDTVKGVDVWISDAAGYKNLKNPVHACLDDVFSLNERIKAPKVILTHLQHGMDYNRVGEELPKGYFMAYDGLELELIM